MGKVLGPRDGPGRGRGAALRALRVDPRRAIQEEEIVCLLCRGLFRQLTNTHLRLHGTTSLRYKRQFGYNRGRPLMCRALLRLYAERAVRQGLASHIRQRPILSQPELRRRGGVRHMALEEHLARREVRMKKLTLNAIDSPSGSPLDSLANPPSTPNHLGERGAPG